MNKFYLGRVVTWEYPEDEKHLGHIVGFGQNCHNETLIKIQPSDIYVTPGHQNVTLPVTFIRPEQLRFK